MGRPSSHRSTTSRGCLGARNRNIKKEKQEEQAELGNNVNIPRGVKLKKVELSHKLKEDEKLIIPKKFYALRHVLLVETEMAVRAAEMCKLENPAFLAVLRPYIMVYRQLNVPVEFVTKHLNWCNEYIHLQAQNGKRQWRVRFCLFRGDPNSGKQIGRGWSSFSEDNNLEQGDVSVFELIKKGKNPVLKVWIYHTDEYAGSTSAEKRRKVK